MSSYADSIRNQSRKPLWNTFRFVLASLPFSLDIRRGEVEREPLKTTQASNLRAYIFTRTVQQLHHESLSQHFCHRSDSSDGTQSHASEPDTADCSIFSHKEAKTMITKIRSGKESRCEQTKTQGTVCGVVWPTALSHFDCPCVRLHAATTRHHH